MGNVVGTGDVSEGNREYGGIGGLDALAALQENATAFFSRLEAAHGERMSCRKGCSACCHVDLSVLESEAARIVAWAMTLDLPLGTALTDALGRAARESMARGPGIDAAGNVRAPCVFLLDDACAVYPARPVICRTQGAALQWRNKDPKKERNAVEVFVDACPLNFDGGRSLPSAAEWLDLDRLGVLQGLAERQFHAARAEGGATEETTFLWKKDPDGRVPLREIATELLRRMGNLEACQGAPTPPGK